MGEASGEGPSRRWTARRGWLVAAGVLVVMVVALGALLVLPRSDDHDAATGTGCRVDQEGPGAAVAMDAATGAERWHRQLGPVTGHVEAAGLLVVLDRAGEATGIDLATGDVRWCHHVDGGGKAGSSAPWRGTLVAAGDVVATMTEGGGVVALDPATGSERWTAATRPVDAPGWALTSYGGYLFVTSAVIGVAQAVPPATGAPTSSPPPTVPRAPVIAVLDPRDGSIAAVSGDPPGPAEAESGPTRVQFVAHPSPDRQEIDLTVTDVPSGSVRWSATVPGFSATIVDEQVVVIDQTGGTGIWAPPSDPRGVSTTLTAYASADGSRRWQAPMSGTPQQTYFAGGLVLSADTSRVVAMDPATGAVRWDADHGSPGTGGSFSVTGSYHQFFSTDDGQVVVGVIVAEEPYRD